VRARVGSHNIVSVFVDDSVDEAAKKMREGGFAQLPVLKRGTNECKGIVTDFALLKRMLSPSTVSKEKWLTDLGKMKIKDADVVDIVPSFPLTALFIEVAQALIYHYAVLIVEADRKVGIVTRADFLRLLSNQK
jgi:predicted transcriptional regulator